MKAKVQAQKLAEKLAKARQKASVSGSLMTSDQAMEMMFHNGSDRKPNPWYRGPEKMAASSTRKVSEKLPLVTLH
ncbi:MAG: hypothetical protein ACO3F7_07130 [Luteolibacter sp.]